MITLSNDHLQLVISSKGAELVSVQDVRTGYEYLWQGDPNHWKRQAPVLFPIVGQLYNDRYSYQGVCYQLHRHGFARDLNFEVQQVTGNSATFNLKQTSLTRQVYPFDFSLQISYILSKNTITVSYEVMNPSDTEPLYYSIGGHPAFKVQAQDQDFADCYLTILPLSKHWRLSLDRGGYVLKDQGRYLAADQVPVRHKLFAKDALVFQIGRGTCFRLEDRQAGVTIQVDMGEMPFAGVWSTYPLFSPFVSLEPWTGTSDLATASGDLTEKFAITRLDPHRMGVHDYAMTFSQEV